MRPIFMRLVCLLMFVSVLAGPVQADDASDVKAVISSQLDAFRSGDGAAAYSYAAPRIQAMFPSPEVFMTMVEKGYEPVYHSRNVVFGDLQSVEGGFRQEVFLNDASGQSWVASYTLERQADGSMKITGVYIRKGSDLAA